MFQTNAFFSVNFVNPDLNPKKLGLKHGLKCTQKLDFSCAAKKIGVKFDIIFYYGNDIKKGYE